jgi:DMSO/TMAO reductase YedYZ molybdopterin-dependent catalytic subunit
MGISSRPATRRTLLRSAAVLGAVAVGGLVPLGRAVAGAPSIIRALPVTWFVDFGTNAEMRWDSVRRRDYLTSPSRLFVRNHTATPTIKASTYELKVFGDGLEQPRTADAPIVLKLSELKKLPHTKLVTTHECTGNGRSFFNTQQGTPAAGTAWTLGAVGAVEWEGVRLRDVLKKIGLNAAAVSIQGAGLDANYVSGDVDYGPVRRPFPVEKALDDALLAWKMDGEPLRPDHGFPLRLVLPGWVGIGSIKWLGSLEVSLTELTSPWNTKWYRMTGGDYPADSPPLTVNPVRSAWELPWGAGLDAGRDQVLTGRSWSGAAPIRKVVVSVDGGATWSKATIDQKAEQQGWTQWSYAWKKPPAGSYVLMARATDEAGRVQPLVTPFNDNGYFFDAVVKHPVTVV